ncbi:DNA topoisomerase II, partial [Pancytospora philotis]
KEHILLRPDTYIGSTDRDSQLSYVWDDEQQRIVQRQICYAPGLYKIFDEILVNAADNKIRDPGMRVLRVDICPERNEISMMNDGKGIPITMHAKEGVYVPELIFGHLLTSSNYDDKEKKVTGGRNGYGAKLCNIFSTRFVVETADGKRQYRQLFEDNMERVHPPTITGERCSEYTRITFSPDLARFGMDRLDEDIVGLMKKRVYDMCGTLRKVAVYLNGVLLEVGSFKEYVGLYLPRADDAAGRPAVVHQKINDRWELALTVSDEQFSQVSFVNSIATSKGGTHVAHVLDQLVEPIIEALKKREKGLDIKPMHVRSSIFLFVNALIENPSFDSQTKENLTLRASAFGSKCGPVDGFVRDVVRDTPLLERIAQLSRAKQSAQLKKTDGAKTSRLSGIPKLEDANNAGTKRSHECTLILTEGDSAKTLAVAGLSVVGRDAYGVFPLRGKLLNVREANHQQIMANAEISAIKKILGLQHGKTYEDAAALRYGHIMIMTDQDHDGSHIKGLIINFLDHFYPSLLRVPGFLQEFITPIIRATRTRRGSAAAEVLDFFTIPEFEQFREAETERSGGAFPWTVKYYKGLGTSTPRDAKQYFSALPKHVKDFHPCSDEDRTLIDLAFNKKKADMRKGWLADFVPGTYLDQSAPVISIKDFINRELILFSMADNIRSIPSVVDGLKPGQRKVLFSCFKRNLKSEIKVAQLVGYVSEQSAYHHGEASLCATIVNLAHDFVGSNNLNLLLPLGSFGSRLQGGKDAASPRYIYTNLSPMARLLFPEHDDPVLTYLTEDNLQIEPEYYVPIIPMVLVNGADGIGTGWSTSIPNYNPLDIIANIRCLMRHEEMQPMTPYYRNFRGEIAAAAEGKYTVSGIVSTDGGLQSITELPVGTWTQTYKEYLESLVQSGAVHDYKEYHTEKTVDFLVSPLKSYPLKLTTSISTSNMICFDAEGKIKRYATPLDIIRDYYPTRHRYYVLRKEHRLRAIADDLVRLSNRVRFIKEVSTGQLVVSRRPVSEICADLTARGYAPISSAAKSAAADEQGAEGYAYLLGMKISSLTRERMDALTEEFNAKQQEYDVLLATSPADLWLADLERLERTYRKMQAEETAEYELELKKKVKRQVSKIRKPTAKDIEKSVATKASAAEAKSGTKKAAKPKKEADAAPKKAARKPRAAKTPASAEDKPAKKSKLSDLIVASSDSSDDDKPWSRYKTS